MTVSCIKVSYSRKSKTFNVNDLTIYATLYFYSMLFSKSWVQNRVSKSASVLFTVY